MGPFSVRSSLAVTTRFLLDKGLNPEHIVLWLHENGGYCECEVLYNVERVFGDIIVAISGPDG